MFAANIRRNAAIVKTGIVFWGSIHEFLISVQCAIMDITELVHFLVTNFSFNVSYDATTAVFFHAVAALPILLSIATKSLRSQAVYLQSVVYCVLELQRFPFAVRLISKYLAFCHGLKMFFFSASRLSVYTYMYR